MIDIKVVTSDQEVLSCYDVMAQLHEKLIKGNFVSHVRRLETKGYKLVCLIDDGTVKSVAGFHLNECIAWENYLYIADLVTGSDSRSMGYGQKLMDWLINYAKEHGCDQIHLDSRVTRHSTHKFYLNQDFILAGYHFHMIFKDDIAEV